MKHNQILNLSYYAIFIGIIFLLGLTPLGLLVLPILPVAVTTLHIPVIIGGYTLGVKGGAVLGFSFGLLSLIRCFTTPDIVATIVLGTGTGFGLYNLFLIVVILFLPRILTGVFAALTYKGLARLDKSNVVAMGVSAFVGSMTNTILFLGMLALFAFQPVAAAYDTESIGGLAKILLGVVGLNGVTEAVVAVILCTAIGKALRAYQTSHKRPA